MNAIVIGVALMIGAQELDDEMERQRGKFVTCCQDETGCEQYPAERGCPPPIGIPTPPPIEAPDETVVARISTEMNARLEWFTANAGPYLSKRGRLAGALVNPGITHVVVASIEGEEAFWAPVEGGWQLRTYCTLRVHRRYRGDVPEGAVLDAIFKGGTFSNGVRMWPAHSPRCLPFDYGTFAFYEADGMLVPVESGVVMSMLGSGVDWHEHPLTHTLDELFAQMESQ